MGPHEVLEVQISQPHHDASVGKLLDLLAGNRNRALEVKAMLGM